MKSNLFTVIFPLISPPRTGPGRCSGPWIYVTSARFPSKETTGERGQKCRSRFSSCCRPPSAVSAYFSGFHKGPQTRATSGFSCAFGFITQPPASTPPCRQCFLPTQPPKSAPANNPRSTSASADASSGSTN